MHALSQSAAFQRVAPLIRRVFDRLDQVPLDLLALLMRIVVGTVFFLSGRTKVDGFSLKSSTFFLFEHEYQVPLISPVLAAYMATFAEHVLPLLLWVGLATRFAALGLLGMTLVIQTFVYPEAWITHGLWASVLIYLVMRGPGAVSVDNFIKRRYG